MENNEREQVKYKECYSKEDRDSERSERSERLQDFQKLKPAE